MTQKNIIILTITICVIYSLLIFKITHDLNQVINRLNTKLEIERESHEFWFNEFIECSHTTSKFRNYDARLFIINREKHIITDERGDTLLYTNKHKTSLTPKQ